MDEPVMSAGSMSGVQEIRAFEAFIDCDSARASMVFPVPGTSSKRMCPSQIIATNDRRMTSALPLMTVSQLATMSSNDFLKRDAFIVPTVYPAAWGGRGPLRRRVRVRPVLLVAMRVPP